MKEFENNKNKNKKLITLAILVKNFSRQKM